MILGILSDTHGKHAAAKRGLELLRDHGATFFVHCGDVGMEDILDLLGGAMLEAKQSDERAGCAFVFGNNDLDRDDLSRYAKSLGLQCFDDFADIQLDGKRIAVAHGDIGSIVRRVFEKGTHDYLFVGHTHVRADDRIKGVRVINPGALYRASRKSVATLDLATDVLTFLELD